MTDHDDPQLGADHATGTGWAEKEPASGSLSERLAYLDSLAPVDDGEFVVAFDEVDEVDGEDEDPAFAEPVYAEPYGDEAYADEAVYDDQDYAVQAYNDQAYDEAPDGAPSDGPYSAVGYSVASATSPVQPTTVPGLTAVASRSRRPDWRSRRLSLPVLALMLVTLAVGIATGFLWLDVRENQQTEAARQAGLDASRDAARQLFSYDYRTLDKDFTTGRALTTGAFRTDYDKTTTKVVADVAKRYKAVVKANVINAGVVRASPDQVVTIVYVNQVTTSTQVTGEKVDLSRVRMTLVRSGDRWLVTKVDAL